MGCAKQALPIFHERNERTMNFSIYTCPMSTMCKLAIAEWM